MCFYLNDVFSTRGKNNYFGGTVVVSYYFLYLAASHGHTRQWVLRIKKKRSPMTHGPPTDLCDFASLWFK